MKSPLAIANRRAYRKRWVAANKQRLNDYMRAYRAKNYARLELKRKCRLAGVVL